MCDVSDYMITGKKSGKTTFNFSKSFLHSAFDFGTLAIFSKTISQTNDEIVQSLSTPFLAETPISRQDCSKNMAILYASMMINKCALVLLSLRTNTG